MSVVSGVSVSGTLHGQKLSASTVPTGEGGSSGEVTRSRKHDKVSVDTSTSTQTHCTHIYLNTHIWRGPSRTVKTMQTLSHLQANKVACHSVIHGGRSPNQR